MSKFGGYDNAYTEYEHTVYHFEIPQEHLNDALDIFAQFFVSPLMKESSVERELRAIESEFMLAKNSDSSRSQQLMAYTCGRSFQEHPASKFGWGNYHSLQTLPDRHGVNTLRKLRTFYDEVRSSLLCFLFFFRYISMLLFMFVSHATDNLTNSHLTLCDPNASNTIFCT